MRKVLSVALVLVLALTVTGVMTLAGDYTSTDVVEIYDLTDLSDTKKAKIVSQYVFIDSNDLVNAEKLVIVSPEGIDESYKKVTQDGNKVVVYVDPIHVTK
ncbi:MAG: hypothetical protein ABEJ25_02885 [Candidatus Bipolaricaulia bacterium]